MAVRDANACKLSKEESDKSLPPISEAAKTPETENTVTATVIPPTPKHADEGTMHPCLMPHFIAAGMADLYQTVGASGIKQIATFLSDRTGPNLFHLRLRADQLASVLSFVQRIAHHSARCLHIGQDRHQLRPVHLLAVCSSVPVLCASVPRRPVSSPDKRAVGLPLIDQHDS